MNWGKSPLFLETPIWIGVSTSPVSQQDNGDGQITLSEFIDGAARLRGGAKALDIWRRLGRSRKTRPKMAAVKNMGVPPFSKNTYFWKNTKIGVTIKQHLGVSENGGFSPQIIH